MSARRLAHRAAEAVVTGLAAGGHGAVVAADGGKVVAACGFLQLVNRKQEFVLFRLPFCRLAPDRRLGAADVVDGAGLELAERCRGDRFQRVGVLDEHILAIAAAAQHHPHRLETAQYLFEGFLAVFAGAGLAGGGKEGEGGKF